MIKLKDLTPELVEMVLNPDCNIKNWERLRHVLLLRLGKRHTQDEIAQLFGVSKERIRQLENRAISILNKKI